MSKENLPEGWSEERIQKVLLITSSKTRRMLS